MQNKKQEKEKSVDSRIKITHNKTLFYIMIVVAMLLIIVLILMSFYSSKNSGNSPASNSCSSDADCMKISSTCCPCNDGGKDVCVSRENATIIKNNLEKCDTANLICAAIYNCNSNQCSCIEGKCQFS